MHAATLNNLAYARMTAFGKTKSVAPNISNGNVFRKGMMAIRIQYFTMVTANTSMHLSKQGNMAHRIVTRMTRVHRKRNPIWKIVRTMN